MVNETQWKNAHKTLKSYKILPKTYSHITPMQYHLINLHKHTHSPTISSIHFIKA